MFYKITSKIMRGGKRSKAYKNFFLFLYDFKKLLWRFRFIIWLLPFYNYKNNDQSFFNKFLRVNKINVKDQYFLSLNHYNYIEDNNVNTNLNSFFNRLDFFTFKDLSLLNSYKFKIKNLIVFFNKIYLNFKNLFICLFIFIFKNYYIWCNFYFILNILFFFYFFNKSKFIIYFMFNIIFCFLNFDFFCFNKYFKIFFLFNYPLNFKKFNNVYIFSINYYYFLNFFRLFFLKKIKKRFFNDLSESFFLNNKDNNGKINFSLNFFNPFNFNNFWVYNFFFVFFLVFFYSIFKVILNFNFNLFFNISLINFFFMFLIKTNLLLNFYLLKIKLFFYLLKIKIFNDFSLFTSVNLNLLSNIHNKFNNKFNNIFFSTNYCLNWKFNFYFNEKISYNKSGIIYLLIHLNLKDKINFKNISNLNYLHLDDILNINENLDKSIDKFSSSPINREYDHLVFACKYYFDINILNIFINFILYFIPLLNYKVFSKGNSEVYNPYLWPILLGEGVSIKKGLNLFLNNLDFKKKKQGIRRFLFFEMKDILFRKHSSYNDSIYIDKKIGYNIKSLRHFRWF